jgi:hypothetical protein
LGARGSKEQFASVSEPHPLAARSVYVPFLGFLNPARNQKVACGLDAASGSAGPPCRGAGAVSMRAWHSAERSLAPYVWP